MTANAKPAYSEDCGRMQWMALEGNAPALEFYKAQGAEMLEAWRLHRFLRTDLQDLLGKT